MSRATSLTLLAASEQNGKKAKKEKKEKKIKDPLAPKRPPSAYLEFQNSVRTQYREAEPETSYQDILRKISSVWSDMPEGEKKVRPPTTEVSRLDLTFRLNDPRCTRTSRSAKSRRTTRRSTRTSSRTASRSRLSRKATRS